MDPPRDSDTTFFHLILTLVYGLYIWVDINFFLCVCTVARLLLLHVTSWGRGDVVDGNNRGWWSQNTELKAGTTSVQYL